MGKLRNTLKDLAFLAVAAVIVLAVVAFPFAAIYVLFRLVRLAWIGG